MTDPTVNDTVWPPTSERDAHLGAYSNVDGPERGAKPASSVDAALAGLTAAQVKPWIEFGARLAARSVEVTVSDDDRESAMAGLRTMAHQRDEAIVQVADLKTELLKTHADLEASLAREQIAQERVAEVERQLNEAQAQRTVAREHRNALRDSHNERMANIRAWVYELIGPDAETGLAGTTPRQLRFLLGPPDVSRAILTGDQGEEQPDETKADFLFIDGTHWYWSTHCRHGYHDKCAATELAPGVPRNPAQCKTCAAPCRCECHEEARADG